MNVPVALLSMSLDLHFFYTLLKYAGVYPTFTGNPISSGRWTLKPFSYIRCCTCVRGDWGKRACFVFGFVFFGTTSGGTFQDVKPGGNCSSHICLMVAAAALAKPRNELPARGPGRELVS